MQNSSKLKAAALAAVAAMGTFAVATTVPASANHHKSAAHSKPTIVSAAQGTGMHETLVAAVSAAGLVETLSGPGPFTVFAPTDDAFGKLPDGTVEMLVQPENKATLTNILTYHVVSGKVSAADLTALIQDNGGSATIETLSGGTLTARIMGGNVVITDAKGGQSMVTQADVNVSNGVIHVTDGVFLPA